MRSTRQGFTLTELLVVIAIIMILVSLLTPTLGRAMDGIRQSACAANLSQMGIGFLRWASEHNNRLPLGTNQLDWPAGNPEPCFPIWVKGSATDPVQGDYRWYGALADEKLIRPQAMYCPAWNPTGAPWAVLGGIRQPEPEYSGWLSPGHRGSSRHIWASYAARSTFPGSGWGAYGPGNVVMDPPGAAIAADHFARPPGLAVYQHHVYGYNVLYMNGETRYYPDPQYEIYYKNNGDRYDGGPGDSAGWAKQEEVWRDLLSK